MLAFDFSAAVHMLSCSCGLTKGAVVKNNVENRCLPCLLLIRPRDFATLKAFI